VQNEFDELGHYLRTSADVNASERKNLDTEPMSNARDGQAMKTAQLMNDLQNIRQN